MKTLALIFLKFLHGINKMSASSDEELERKIWAYEKAKNGIKNGSILWILGFSVPFILILAAIVIGVGFLVFQN